MNPLESINDSCRKMKKLSQAIQAARGNSSTDVSDIFDISSSILTTLLKKTTDNDIDPNKNLLEIENTINNIFKSKQPKFILKMETLFSQTADRVNILNEITKKLKNNTNYVIQNNSQLKDITLNKLEKEYLNDLHQYTEKLKESEDAKRQEQKFAYENLESYLSHVNKDISNRYTEQLEQFDQIINAHEIKLQQVVHDKHIEIQKKAEIMENEEKRYLSELERISTEQQQLRISYEEKINQMKLLIANLKDEIGQKRLSNEELLVKYEDDLIALHQYQKNENQEKLDALQNEIQSLSTQKNQIELKKKQTNIECQNLISNQNNDFNEKLKLMQNETNSMKSILNQEIENLYKPKFDSLNTQIEKFQSIKNEKFKKFKEEQNQLNLIQEDDARKLKEKSEKEILLNYEKLKEKKLQLKNVQNERNEDLSNLKNEKMQILADVMQQKDERTKERSETTNQLMKQVMIAQKELFDKNFFPDEKMQLHKGIVIERIQKAGFESTDNYDLDDDFINLKKEFHDHDEKMRLIQNKMDIIYQNIEELNSKLDSINKSRIRLLEKYVGSNDESLLVDLEKVSKLGSENSDVQNLFGRLVTLSTIINQKTDSLINEVNQISNSMSIEKARFERNLKEIENQIENSKQILDNRQDLFNNRKSSIEKKLCDQKKLMANQDIEFDQNCQNLDNFQNSFENAKSEYEEDNRKLMQQTVIDFQQKSISIQKQIEEVRSNFDKQMNLLKQKLENAKQMTSTIREKSLASREKEKLKENTKMQQFFNQKEQELTDNHHRKIDQINSDRHSFEQQKLQERYQLNETFKLQINSFLKDFNSQLNDLKNENSLALTESQRLEHELEVLQTCPCQKCEQKKEILRRLLEKKKEMEKKIEMHQDQAKQNDQNISVMMGFKKPQQGYATPLLELQQKQQHHGPTIAKPARAKTSLAFK